MHERGRAFAPGHLTLFFSVHHHEDPRRAGSRGVGLTVEEGVSVTAEPGEGTTVRGEAMRIEAVERVLDALDVSARVDVETDLPLGQGFGVSGAAALATAYAANVAFSLAKTENELIEVAHVAEVEAGSGLGDVVAQARGGVPIRLSPGGPGFGDLDGIPAIGRIEYRSLGSMSTEATLAGDTAGLSRAGERALDALMDAPSLRAAVALGRTFARETGLLDDELGEIVDAVVANGGEACLGLLGRTVVAVDDGLSNTGYEAVSTTINQRGAGGLEPS